jgi:hypothetical protein
VGVEYVTIEVPVPTVDDALAFLIVAALFVILVLVNRMWWRE